MNHLGAKNELDSNKSQQDLESPGESNSISSI